MNYGIICNIGDDIYFYGRKIYGQGVYGEHRFLIRPNELTLFDTVESAAKVVDYEHYTCTSIIPSDEITFYHILNQ